MQAHMARKPTRVYILAAPGLISDALSRVVGALDGVRLLPALTADVAVVVLPLETVSEVELNPLVGAAPGAKWIALSLGGERGLLHLPNGAAWRDVHPFSLADLLREIGASLED